MKTAQQLRDDMRTSNKRVQQMAIYKAKRIMDKAIVEAINNNQHYASFTLPEGMTENTQKAMAISIQKLGYSVSLEKSRGYFGTNLVRMPQVVMTVGWDK